VESRALSLTTRSVHWDTRHAVTKKVLAAALLAAAMLMAGGASPAFGRSCSGGSVDGAVPTAATPMCFGSMFPRLPAFHFSDQAAADLVATMEDPAPDPAGVDRGSAEDSATVPSEYTYLGQFIDHNLDFDRTPQPTANVNPSSVSNYESFRFDLNDVFGGGPSVDPQLYAADGQRLLVSGKLGVPQADGFPTVTGNHGVFDLARTSLGQAILVEPRNDENQILSQIHAAFVAFYNNFIKQGDSYAQARQLTDDYYQEIVLTDLLPAYVGQSTVDRYLHFGRDGTAQLTTPAFPNAAFTPVEFTVGAYRFGHALVRQLYHINDIDPTAPVDIDDNVTIFDLDHFQSGDLSGGAPLPGPNLTAASSCTSTTVCTQPDPAGHQIQWRYFVPALAADPADPGINFARTTQTTISPALFNLPAETIAGCTDAASPVCNGSGNLVSRDFARGNYYGLASGQTIAVALGCPVIPARTINPTSDAVFNIGTPLLYYVLAEARRSGQTLGCVGRSIVAQTFLRVLWQTPNSILRSGFRPDPQLVKLAPERPRFSFGDLLVDVGLAPRSS
jgi:hypothetical protein